MSAWQKLIVVLLAAAIFGGAAYFARVVSRPVGEERDVPWVTYVPPSVKMLQQARGKVAAGSLPEARAILVGALNSSPHSPVTREMRDLLGQIDTELFFSKESTTRKTEYIVKRGDALASIARKLESSTDVIMKVNDLDSTFIRPGEKLSVPQLDFTITIDLPRERVVVHDSRGFFTQYPIASAELPPTRAPQVETKVRAKSFWENGRPVAHAPGKDDDAMPWIFLHQRGYVLYGVDENSEVSDAKIDVEEAESSALDKTLAPNRPPQGIAMLKKDIAQLDLLIRTGTPVTIIRDRK